MTVYKKIEIELTPEEEQTLLRARDTIDDIIEKMNKYNLSFITTDYGTYDSRTLDEIATELHSLTTVFEGE